jgi:hypothetical protein
MLKDTMEKEQHALELRALVGGYSFATEGHASAKRFTPCLTLITVMAIGLIVIRRKTTKRALEYLGCLN